MIRYAFVREPSRGRTLRGDVRIPEGPPPRTAVVVVHGFKGFKDWGFFPWVAERLVGAGHAVVSFNFSGSGIGDDLESFTELDAFASNTFTRELDELALVVDEVVGGELLSRRPDAVGLLGHSRGGADVVLHTGRDPRIDALVTWAAIATFDRWSDETKARWREDGIVYVLNSRTGQQMPLDVALLDDFEANRARLDVTAAAERVSVPWLVVHGDDDLTVSSEDARALVRRGSEARLVLVPGAGHTFEAVHPFAGPTPELTRALDETLGHFRRHLPSGGRPPGARGGREPLRDEEVGG